MHGTFENVQKVPSTDLEGYQIGSSSQKTASAPPKNKFRYALLAVPVLLIICGVAFVSTSKPLIAPKISTETSLSSGISAGDLVVPSARQIVTTPVGEISIVASNEYGVYDTSIYPYFADFPGSQLVEPYKETTITLKGKAVESGNYNFVWTIDDNEPFTTGSKAVIKLTKAGIYSLNIHAFDLDGVYQSTYSTSLIAKFVKREIRSLTEADRESFLDAMSAIWTLSQSEGEALYGANFTAIHTLVREHAIASGDIMCDQFHEGTGFLTHHLALSNSFEASMRAVDPSVTLHYWDFTVEGQTIANAEENPSYFLDISPVFSSKWFGAVENNIIVNSRWKGVKMPMVEDGEEETTPHNSYGYIRSYWNNNNESLITRHMFDACGTEPTYKQVPTCQMHYDVLNTESLGDFQDLSPGDGHGPMHVQIGGMYGGCTEAMEVFQDKWADYLDYNLTTDEITATGQDSDTFVKKWGYTAQRRAMFNKAIVGEYFHIYRGFWRSHMCAVDNSPALLECPESCDVCVPFEQCTCEMPALTSGDMDWTNLFPCILNSETNQEYFNKTMSVEFMKELTFALATSSVKEGEMLEAASPADPMFWMIHTVIERLLAAKRLSTVTSMGGAQFNKWKGVMGSSYTTWRDSSYYDLKKGENAWYPEAYDCYGHAYDEQVLPDALQFTPIIQSVADTDEDGVITNWEFYQALDPNNVYLNDYVFDNFDWDHCEGAVVEDLSTSIKSGSIEEQGKFTFAQVTFLMALVIVVVMLFTGLQFVMHRRAKGTNSVPLSAMTTSNVSYDTHSSDKYIRDARDRGEYVSVR